MLLPHFSVLMFIVNTVLERVHRGCVIFGGDNELKTLLQWMAASVTGRELHYQAFGDKTLLNMQSTLLQIREKFPTVKDLFQAILHCAKWKPRGGNKEWSLWQALLRMKTA